MPDVPDEAVRAALAARADLLSDRPSPMVLSEETLTRLMLEAAAPAMAAAVAVKIAEHMDKQWSADKAAGLGAPADYARLARRHFRAAAQVAALAFCTDEDVKRLAAEALNRGDFIACPALETGEDDHG